MRAQARRLVVGGLAALAVALAAFSGVAGERRPGGETALVATDIRIHPNGDAEIRISADPMVGLSHGVDRNRADAQRLFAEILENRVVRRLDRVTVGFDDAEQRFLIDAWAPRFADGRRGLFEIDVPSDAMIIHSDPGLIMTIHHSRGIGGHTAFVTKYLLPPDSHLDNYDLTTGILSYRTSGPGQRPPRPPRPDERHRDPFRRNDPAGLAGRWEFRLIRSQPLPPGAPMVYMDLNPEGPGYGGTVVLDQRKPGENPVVMRIYECRLGGNRISVKARMEMREGGKVLIVDHAFDGTVTGDSMVGNARFDTTIVGEVTRTTDMELTYYHIR